MLLRTLLLAAAFSVGTACAPGDFLSGGDGDDDAGDAGTEAGDDAGDDSSDDYPAPGGYGMDLGSGYPSAGDSTGETDEDAGALFDAATNG